MQEYTIRFIKHRKKCIWDLLGNGVNPTLGFDKFM